MGPILVNHAARQLPSYPILEWDYDRGPLFAGDRWDDRPTLGRIVSRSPSAIPAGQTAGLVARSGEAIPVAARRWFD
jgi:hypothetical protein